MSENEQGPHIIVVDGQDGLRWLYQHWLESDGYRVRVTADRTDLEGMLADCEPDLILLDLHLRGLEGIRICQAIKADPRWAPIPIIGTSHEAGGLAGQLAHNAGADNLLVKPFSRIELELGVEGLLGRGGGTGINDHRADTRVTEAASGTGGDPLPILTPQLEDGTC